MRVIAFGHSVKNYSTIPCKFLSFHRIRIPEFVKVIQLYDFIIPRFVLQVTFTGTLKPTYLSCEFAFRVRFQHVVRALSYNCVGNENQCILKLMNIHLATSNFSQ